MLLHSYLYLNDWLHYVKGIIESTISTFFGENVGILSMQAKFCSSISRRRICYSQKTEIHFLKFCGSWLSQLLKIKFVVKILNDNDVNSTKSWMPSRRILERTNYERNFVLVAKILEKNPDGSNAWLSACGILFLASFNLDLLCNH
jgi:hypothetical protein